VATGAPPDPPLLATDDEELTRFLTQSGHYNTRGVTARAFSLPRAETKLSIFRTNGFDDAARWRLGDDRIPPIPTRRVLGVGLFTPVAIAGAGLRLERDAIDHPRHASICDWPPDKEGQKDRATALAALAALRLRHA
jgi:hypothetical protein